MIKYSKIANKNSLLQSLTGLNRAAFRDLLKGYEKILREQREKAESERETPRQRASGGGRKAVLGTAADQMLLILFYFRHYPTQEVLGFLFGFSQAQANEWIQRLTPILNGALGAEQHIPAREKADVKRVLAACPGLEFIIDGCARPIRRPKDTQSQKQYYSGKKKRHTVKNITISEKRTKKIKALSPKVEGKKHDKTLTDEQGYAFPEGSKLWKDTGFQGYEPSGVETHQPKKKPKGGELTPEEKAQNQRISQERIGIEHSLGGVKVFRIVADVFRNLLANFDDLCMETACGLHNLRLNCKLTA